MNKRFKTVEPNVLMLDLPSLDEWMSQGHPVGLMGELIDPGLEPAGFYASSAKAKSSRDPRLMSRILRDYCVGVRSSRELMQESNRWWSKPRL